MASERGKSGKFMMEKINAGRKKMPDKMKRYQRKVLKGGTKKGRRPYPWRKK